MNPGGNVAIMDVKTLCLGVLTFGDASGYEIRGYFEEGPFSHFFQAGFGSIYPALGKALNEGLVTCRSEAQDGRPDKKIYSLTPAGQACLTQELHEFPAFDKIRSEFLVTLFFARFLQDDHLESIYDAYLAEYERNIDKMNNLEAGDVPAGQAFVRELGKEIYQSIGSFLRDNRDRFLTEVAAANNSSKHNLPKQNKKIGTSK